MTMLRDGFAGAVCLSLLAGPVFSQAAPSAEALVQRALRANQDLAAARLDVDRARARLRQAGLRPNPALDVQASSGALAGADAERDFSVGVAIPVELGAKRQRRVEVAELELAAAEAAVADRERLLRQQVLHTYAAVLAAARDVELTTGLYDLDVQTARIVSVRVEQEDASPLERNLLQTEVARLRAQRALAGGRLQAALITLRAVVGAPPGEPLVLDDTQAALAAPPAPVPESLEGAIAVALEQRPDLRLSRLNQAAAQAGVALARAGAVPDLTVTAGVSTSRTLVDVALPAPVPNRDRALTFGISLPLPFFNANQGAIAEAGVMVEQARAHRSLAEQTVRSEVAAAYARVAAAGMATDIGRDMVGGQSMENLRVVRAAYELGEYRITDVITEQRRVLDAAREYTDALVERYAAAVDLDAAMGGSGGGTR